ncbi:nucleotidyltransferase family protein [Arthrobacter sp. AL12]|uniref:nucleotidyltransferase family protein n=1 Tax=Arthrobacter sp. AL12 TaxID=3042241 RepID=UPI00249CD25D|nr:nucleotidyltransferase family protein [Arthrobacter sp. AL12]MDI3213836.1 nucleotidyltransferase family protein [Arthrobacter sp. AL12]
MDVAETLHQNEAVLLATALVDFVAASAGLPVLFIKGPGATLMGLRENHVSADVDVLIRPEQLERMLNLLHGRGWQERPTGFAIVSQYLHSRTLYHPQWNCDIDVHSRFPGMEAPPDIAFDTLWRDRQYLVMAARNIAVPSVPAAVIFQALHSLRAMDDPRHQREYTGLLQRVDTTLHRDIVELSVELKATSALQPLLEELGADGLPTRDEEVSAEWRYRTSAHVPGTALLIALMESPWRSKPRVFARGIFPSRQYLRQRDPDIDDSVAGLLGAHVSRWHRGLAGLPGAARKIRDSRRG